MIRNALHIFRLGDAVFIDIIHHEAHGHGATAHLARVAPGAGHARHIQCPGNVIARGPARRQGADARQQARAQGGIRFRCRAAGDVAGSCGPGLDACHRYGQLQGRCVGCIAVRPGLHSLDGRTGRTVFDPGIGQGHVDLPGRALQLRTGGDGGTILAAENGIPGCLCGGPACDAPDGGPAFQMFGLGRIRHDLPGQPVQIAVQAVGHAALHAGQDGQQAAAQPGLAVKTAVHIGLDAGNEFLKGGTFEWHGHIMPRASVKIW